MIREKEITINLVKYVIQYWTNQKFIIPFCIVQNKFSQTIFSIFQEILNGKVHFLYSPYTGKYG